MSTSGGRPSGGSGATHPDQAGRPACVRGRWRSFIRQLLLECILLFGELADLFQPRFAPRPIRRRKRRTGQQPSDRAVARRAGRVQGRPGCKARQPLISGDRPLARKQVAINLGGASADPVGCRKISVEIAAEASTWRANCSRSARTPKSYRAEHSGSSSARRSAERRLFDFRPGGVRWPPSGQQSRAVVVLSP